MRGKTMNKLLTTLLLTFAVFTCAKDTPAPVATPELVDGSCLQAVVAVITPDGQLFASDKGCHCLWRYKEQSMVDFHVVDDAYCEAEKAKQNGSE
jgi:hypothetical protein